MNSKLLETNKHNIMLGGEQIISPLKSFVKNNCIRASVARVAKFCVTNKSRIIFDQKLPFIVKSICCFHLF